MYDVKKEEKEYYSTKKDPVIVNVPAMKYVCVEGVGNPNDSVEYQQAIQVLYAISYTIKMSYKGSREIEGYYPYVVPPLEGFWWMANGYKGVDYSRKDLFAWVSMIRLPEFVNEEVFEWAKHEVETKKKIDCSKAKFEIIEEGLCVQCFHLGPYDHEPETVAKMDAYIAQMGYENDLSDERRHHEIYLNDPRKVAPEKLKTVIRHPIRK